MYGGKFILRFEDTNPANARGEGCSRCQEEKCEKEAYVVIENGEFKRGVIDAHAYKALDKYEL